MFLKHYIVIDDFYPNPEEIRTLALQAPTGSPGSGKWAGAMTDGYFFTAEHEQALQMITAEPVCRSDGLCGYFRFTNVDDQYQQHIHFDPKPGQVWAGVVYLSDPTDIDTWERPDHQCGTSFWRHNRTGLDSIPLDQAELERHGWNNVNDLRNFLETEGLDESLWQKTFYVPSKFNRLVLFRPWMFHSPGKAFGTDKQNCRLVQLFFLRLKDGFEPCIFPR
jgi:hypothetical protein